MDLTCKYCNKEYQSIRALMGHIGQVHKIEYHKDVAKQYAVVGGDVLDITNGELELLRKNHSNKCEICGKYETSNTRPDAKITPNKLCVDHNHSTGQFRGFICVQCNRNMGWLDKFYNEIIEYNKPYKSKVKK